MADIQSIWKPRRGKKSTMAGVKKDTILQSGEFFCEVPDTGVGTGHGKVKMGDGATKYEDLPYLLGDTENNKIAFTENTSETVDSALNAVQSGGMLKNLIAGLKQAIKRNQADLTKLNDDFAKFEQSFQDGCKKIVDKLTALGYEPEDPQGPDEINTEIQNIYDKRYTEGYSDGMKHTVSGNATIQYIYHNHSAACGGISCAVRVYYDTPRPNNPGVDDRLVWYRHERHSSCGLGLTTTSIMSQTKPADSNYSHTTYRCGKTQGQLEGATIVYK